MGQAESSEAPAKLADGQALPSALVIVGPSGVGKGTLIEKLMADGAGKFGFSCSHTTRSPRPGEVNGQHYHFTTREAFEADIAEGKFLEHAYVHSNIYGTSIQAVRDVATSGRCCVLDIDVQGARQVRKADLRAIFVFIAPPSLEELEKRLRGRATDSEEQITTRLRNAREEMASMDEPGLYDYVLTNNSLEECYQQLKAVAERALGGDVGGPEAATAAAAAVAAKGAGEQQQQAAAASMEQRQQQQQQPGSPEAALGAAATFKGWLSERAPAGLERWRGSVALVTGAGGGVGAALAASLAAAGLRVVAVSRRKHALEALQAEVAASAGGLTPAQLAEVFLPVVADVTKEAEVVALPRIVAKRWPGSGVDVLINCAASRAPNAGLLDGSTGAWVEMVSTNVLGAAMAAREAAKDMRMRKAAGHVINIGCTVAEDGSSGGSDAFFAATKAALKVLTDGLRSEARAAGLPLRVSLVSPGAVAASGGSSGYSAGSGTPAPPPRGQLSALDVVAAVRWVLSAPEHVDVSEVVVRAA